jgi:hypothetical protein
VVRSLGLVGWGRGGLPDQMAVIAMLLVPVLFNPVNYHLHFVCLLPLIADELRAPPTANGEGSRFLTADGASIWLIALGVCVAQYWTVLERDETLHFRFATVLYFAAMTLVIVQTIRKNAVAPPTAMPAEP